MPRKLIEDRKNNNDKVSATNRNFLFLESPNLEIKTGNFFPRIPATSFHNFRR